LHASNKAHLFDIILHYKSFLLRFIDIMAKSIPKLLLQDYTTAEKQGHFARTIMNYENNHDLHTHDFYEVLWIEKGEGWHHINHQKIELQSGSLCFIRPSDVHGFNSKTGSRLIVANIAFPEETKKYFIGRYKESLPYFDHKGSLPYSFDLDQSKLLELSRNSQFLGEGPQQLFRTEGFLLGLLSLLIPQDTSSEYNDLPEWLKYACQRIEHNKAFQEGTHALVKLAGRSPEHVARTLRKLRGATPTDIINQVRMRFCSNALASTDDKIAQIALDAGFQNLGHFYQVFRKTYHLSPRQYRLQQRSIFRGKP